MPSENEIPVRTIEEETGREGDEVGQSAAGGQDTREFVDEEGHECGSREPRKLRDPKLPSPEEVRAHELTHLPYRSWCVHCVRGKGKSMDHRRGEGDAEVREVHVDYCFMGGQDDDKTKCIVIAKDRMTKMIMCSVVPTKGGRDEFPAKRICAFIRELGLEHVDLTLKGDQEPALCDLKNEIARIRKPAATLLE